MVVIRQEKGIPEQPMAEKTPSPSCRLPAEVWVRVLGHLTSFRDLHAFGLASRWQQDLFKQFESLLYYQICRNLGYLEEHSYGSSSAIYPSSSSVASADNQTLDPSRFSLSAALELAKVNQKTVLKTKFDGANNWTNFSKLKYLLQSRWREGQCYFAAAVKVTLPSAPIWRWKFDPDFAYWAMTSQSGGLRVTTYLPQLPCFRIWHSTNTQPYSHLESSGPYLVTTDSQSHFLVWKRQDQSFDHSQVDPIPFKTRDLYDHQGRRVGRESYNGDPMFKLHHTIDTLPSTRCFKARAPFLVAGCISPSSILVWNLETGKLVEHYDASDRPTVDMLYIELDRSFVFLAGSESVSIYDRQNGSLVYEIGGNLSPSHNRYVPVEWVAIHHDVRGGHLLALSRSGWLIWASKYGEMIRGNPVTGEKAQTVFMNFGQDGAEGHNLCVENGRAVFSIACGRSLGHAPMEMLFLLHLSDWANPEDLAANPPQLEVLYRVVPSFRLTTRIEMDSCGIYMTSAGMCWEAHGSIYPTWETLNNFYLQHGVPRGSWNYEWLDECGVVLLEQEVLDRFSPEPSINQSAWLNALRNWRDHAQWNDNNAPMVTEILKIQFVDPRNINPCINLPA